MKRWPFVLLVVSFVVFVATACIPPPQPKYPWAKWEAWRISHNNYQWHSECRDLFGNLVAGFYNAANNTICLNSTDLNRTKKLHPTLDVFGYVINHEAAHRMDHLLGFPQLKAECPRGCTNIVAARAFERGAECILQLVRPDLDVVRQTAGYWSDAYWRCDPAGRARYTPMLRFAGVLP